MGFFFISCSNEMKYEYQEFQTIPGQKWDRFNPAEFTYSPSKEGLKNFYFYLENTQEYPYNNIFIIVQTNRNNKNLVDTLEYQMADGRGRWLGRKIKNTFENLLVLKTNVRVDKNETIKFKIEPATRSIEKVEGDEKLKGIVRVGLIVENLNN